MTTDSRSILPPTASRYSAQRLIYDAMGRVIKQSNPTETNDSWIPSGDDSVWFDTEQAYDWKSRPTQTTNADGSTRVVSYGGCGCAGGEVATVQDEHGRQRRLTKDSFGRLWKVEELKWDATVYATTTYTYNSRDQLTQSNQAGQLRSFAYDGYGRLQTRTTPEQGATNYSYNADNTTDFVTDARGAKTIFAYNPRRLVTGVSYDLSNVIPGQNVAATPNVLLTYDAAGNRKTMTDGLGGVTYSYDNLSQLTSETRSFNGLSSYTLSYSYNLVGELSSITNPLGTLVNYGYDKIGRLTGATGAAGANPSTYASGLTYRAFGAIKGMNYGDGRVLSTTYDSRMRATTWDVSNVLGYNYNYDYLNEHTGRVTYAGSIYDATLDRSYEYDQVGRLVISHSGTEARAHVGTGQWGTMDGPYSQGYEFDVWGNVTHKYGWGGEVQGGGAGQSSDIYYAYTNNRRNGFSYDAAGNLTNDLGQIFTYDATGQQATAAYSGYSLQQNYDGDGLRVKKNDNGTVVYYLRSSVLGRQVVAEINASGVVARTYTYLGAQLLALRNTNERGSGAYWIHEDPITKSKRVTNSLGTVVSTVEMDPWGADTNRSSNAAFQPRKFTSYERDANGTDEAMFRRYNRWQSRFDQPDPYDGSYDASDPQSFNRYAYVQNDPVNFIDPSGLQGHGGGGSGGGGSGGGGIDFPIPWWTNPDGSIGTGFDLPGGDVYAGYGGIGGGSGGRGLHGPLLDTPEGAGGGGGIGLGIAVLNGALQGQRFGRKDKEARCKKAIAVATAAIGEIDRRMGNAISAPNGLNQGHQRAISQDISRLKGALDDIEKNCFDGPGGPPLLPDLADSINKLRENASTKLRVPPVGWSGGRLEAENRIKAVAFGANIGSVLFRVALWLRYAVAF